MENLEEHRNPFYVSNTTRILYEIGLDQDYEAVTKTDYGAVVIRSKKTKNQFDIPEVDIEQIRSNWGQVRDILCEKLKTLILRSDGKLPYH